MYKYPLKFEQKTLKLDLGVICLRARTTVYFGWGQISHYPRTFNRFLYISSLDMHGTLYMVGKLVISASQHL